MIDGHQIKEARNRAGMTQQELAIKIGVTLRTVGNWERGATVPRDREPRLREVLAGYLHTGQPPAPVDISQATDAQILAEVARRFDRSAAEGGRARLAEALYGVTSDEQEHEQQQLRAARQGRPHLEDTDDWEPR